MSIFTNAAHHFAHWESDPESLVGAVLAERFEVQTFVGEGGLGRVYLATDLRTGHGVALRTPLPERINDADCLQRFEEGATAAVAVNHPNVARIHEVVMETIGDEPPFATMDFVVGEEIDRFLKKEEETLTVGVLAELVRGVAAGLDAIHAAGLVHGDIRPGSILVSKADRVPRIINLGFPRE